MLKSEKIKDIRNLLQVHFGDDWQGREELEYFSALFNSCNAHSVPAPVRYEDEESEEDFDLRNKAERITAEILEKAKYFAKELDIELTLPQVTKRQTLSKIGLRKRPFSGRENDPLQRFDKCSTVHEK